MTSPKIYVAGYLSESAPDFKLAQTELFAKQYEMTRLRGAWARALGRA